MANMTKTRAAGTTSILGDLLHPGLPMDTDGLPGLVDAPAVYELILRDLREDDLLTDGHPAVAADPRANQGPTLEKSRRPD